MYHIDSHLEIYTMDYFSILLSFQFEGRSMVCQRSKVNIRSVFVYIVHKLNHPDVIRTDFANNRKTGKMHIKLIGNSKVVLCLPYKLCLDDVRGQ